MERTEGQADKLEGAEMAAFAILEGTDFLLDASLRNNTM